MALSAMNYLLNRVSMIGRVGNYIIMILYYYKITNDEGLEEMFHYYAFCKKFL